MFLPTTAKELDILGWELPDIILITGTGYVDRPSMRLSEKGTGDQANNTLAALDITYLRHHLNEKTALLPSISFISN